MAYSFTPPKVSRRGDVEEKNMQKGFSTVAIFGVVGVILLGLIGYAVWFGGDTAVKTSVTPTPMVDVVTVRDEEVGGEEQAMADSGAMLQNKPRYMDYSEADFAAAGDSKRVLFFHAPWCPTCRPADREFRERANEIPEGVVVFKTDYDSETELKQKYRITYQHTYVLVDEAGNEVSKWNGGAVDELLDMIRI
jgi:thiol-disulfide isomerase/thioredoxin